MLTAGVEADIVSAGARQAGELLAEDRVFEDARQFLFREGCSGIAGVYVVLLVCGQARCFLNDDRHFDPLDGGRGTARVILIGHHGHMAVMDKLFQQVGSIAHEVGLEPEIAAGLDDVQPGGVGGGEGQDAVEEGLWAGESDF